LIWAAVGVGLLTPAPPAMSGRHFAPALAAAVTVAPDEVTASADAEAQGTPVEALSDRTNYTQVFANPDGTFSYNAASAAQRTQNADGTWSDLDPTLALQSDGTVRSAASQTGLVLSGGGSGPLVTMSNGSASLTIASPVGALPAPTLSGATATYASVLPGVDLQVTASTEGVMETLVIYTAAAASNSALQSLSFGVGTTGLAVTADTDGGALVNDSSGNVVFDVPEPQAWDSTGSGSTATLAGDSAAIAPLPLTVTTLSSPQAGTIMGTGGTSQSLSMSTSSFLSDASRTYPKFIGKQVTLHGPSTWLDVGRNNGGGSWGDWEPQNSKSGGVTHGGLRIGASCKDDGYGNCINSTRYEYRSFMNFPVPHQIWGADKISSTLYTNEDWSWTCGVKTTAELWQTDHARKGAVWNGPTERVWQNGQKVAYGNTCLPHGVSFNASSAAAAAASGKWSSLTLELRAYINDENNWNVDSWKRFSIITNASKSPNDTPYLQIIWAHKPTAPTDAGTLDGSREVGCGSNVWISTRTPTLEATIGDVDGLQLQAQYHWAKSTGSPSGSYSTPYLKSGSQFTFTIPSSSNIPDGMYTWNVNGNDQPAGYAPLTGPSASCSFGVDTTAPVTPSIAGPASSVPIGTVVTFTFTDPTNKDFDGVNDVVGYRYGFSNQPLNYVAAGTDTSRTATVKISPVWLGSRTLYVLAVDRAGNLSPDTATSPPAEFNLVTVRSTTNPTPLLAEWKLDEGSGTVAHDATGNGHDATLGAQAGWGAGRASGTSALSLTGAPDSEAVTAAQLPPVDNTGSFTVSAWVKLSPSCATDVSKCNFYDPVSMDGNVQASFALEYVTPVWCGTGAGNGTGCWAFTMTTSDVSGSTSTAVEATTPIAFGAWVHLVGVYDVVHQSINIYVNGEPAAVLGPVYNVAPWAAMAQGPLRIGRVEWNGGAFNWWPGEVSDVCTFWGALDATQIGRVHSSGCSSAGAP
jgi:hypothetical protein